MIVVVVVAAVAGKAVAELNSSLLVNYRHESETGNQVAFMQIKKTTLRPQVLGAVLLGAGGAVRRRAGRTDSQSRG